MVAVRHLANPPIAEAAIAFRVQPHPDAHKPDFAEKIREVGKRLAASGSKVEELHQRAVQFKIGGESNTVTSQEATDGLRIDNGAGIVTVMRRDEFVVGLVGKYDTFESLLDAARSSWQAYRDMMQPLEVLRIGLRYINRIPLTLPIQVSDYFTAIAGLPEELDQEIESYFFQATVPIVEAQAKVTITHALEAKVTGNLDALLDLDVFAHTQLDPGGEELWARLATFRACKNRYFFGLVTEKTLEPFL
jgi:uncharacterized protein (TIGR04255 family)